MLDDLIPSEAFRARFAQYERPRRLIDAPWFARRMDELDRVGEREDQRDVLRQLREAAEGVRSPLELPGHLLDVFRSHGAEQGVKRLGRVLPTTPLIALYRAMKHPSSQPEHHAIAEALLAAHGLLVEAVRESAGRFAAYPNAPQPEGVRGGTPDDAPFDPSRRGRVVAHQLSVHRTVVVSDAPELSFRYVAREALPARATDNARFDDVAGTPAGSAISTDLLLANVQPGSPPIFAELKVAEGSRYDANPFYALVQTLAVATQAATRAQRQRFASHYPGHFAPSGDAEPAVDAYVVIHGEPPAKHKLWHALDERAAELAARLTADPKFTSRVRRLVGLNLATPDAEVPSATVRWPVSAPAAARRLTRT